MQMTSGGNTVNGALQYAVELATRQAERGHEVTVLAPEGSWVAQQVAGRDIRHIPSDLRRWPLDELRRVRDFVAAEGIDVVHGHSSRAFNFGVCLRRLYGVPCVSTAHSNKIQVHWALADHVIAVSAATLRFHRRWNWVRPSRISVIHNPIDTQRFRPLDEEDRRRVRREVGLGETAPVLLIAGHVIRRKGQRVAVRALPRILAEVPEAQLVLVGHESHEYGLQVRAEAERLGVQRSVHWLASRSDVERIFAIADVCWCPSLDEPFGLTACEALACEVPVIASRLGGFLETVHPGQSGELVQQGDERQLAEATLELLADPPRRRRYGRHGRRWVEENLASDVHDDAVEAVYRAVARTAGQ